MRPEQLTPAAFKKLTSGHPWLNKKDFKSRELPERSCFVFFGEHWWAFSPESFICLRRFGPVERNFLKSDQMISDGGRFVKHFGEWLQRHLNQTLRFKKVLLPEGDDLVLRWIFSENDLVPGLTVDIFGRKLVCQINSAPMELVWLQLRELLAGAFKEAVGIDAEIIELRQNAVRREEGLPIIPAEEAKPVTLRIGGFQRTVHPGGSQKTGAYIDQTNNHLTAAKLAKALGYKSAWDIFSFQGGFSIPLLAEGLEVHAVDDSQPALDVLIKDVRLNSLDEGRCSTHKADTFLWLREVAPTLPQPDMIVLDPPAFAKSGQDLKNARRGYKELNLQAMKHLPVGGLLASCVCSHHMSRGAYEGVLREAAHDARRELQVLEIKGPSPDHGRSLFFPQGEYLHAWFLRII